MANWEKKKKPEVWLDPITGEKVLLTHQLRGERTLEQLKIMGLLPGMKLKSFSELTEEERQKLL